MVRVEGLAVAGDRALADLDRGDVGRMNRMYSAS
jgi:hypothetical protein